MIPLAVIQVTLLPTIMTGVLLSSPMYDTWVHISIIISPVYLQKNKERKEHQGADPHVS